MDKNDYIFSTHDPSSNLLLLFCSCLIKGYSFIHSFIHSFDEEFEITGYTLLRKDRGSKGGGIAIYARDDLIVTRRDDLETSDVEGLWLEIHTPKSRSFLLGTFYRPPNSSNHYDKDFGFVI